jgi:hypothetical protein
MTLVMVADEVARGIVASAGCLVTMASWGDARWGV